MIIKFPLKTIRYKYVIIKQSIYLYFRNKKYLGFNNKEIYIRRKYEKIIYNITKFNICGL